MNVRALAPISVAALCAAVLVLDAPSASGGAPKSTDRHPVYSAAVDALPFLGAPAEVDLERTEKTPAAMPRVETLAETGPGVGTGGCEQETWPYVSNACLGDADEGDVRTVRISTNMDSGTTFVARR